MFKDNVIITFKSRWGSQPVVRATLRGKRNLSGGTRQATILLCVYMVINLKMGSRGNYKFTFVYKGYSV